MSCLPQTPIGVRLLDSGWITPSTAIDTANALGIGEPLYAEVIVISGIASATNQTCILRQILFEETASSSGNIKKPDVLVLLWTRTTSIPTTPTANTIYNPVTTNYIGAFPIAEANYVRWSDTVWQARIAPDYIFTTGTEAVSVDFHCVILSNEATPVTFASSAATRIRAVCEPSV